MYAVELRDYQLFQLNIVKEFVRICKKEHLRYWLSWGTLLGAARHNGFIPWDDDIDLWMPARDYLKFREICKKELGNEYYFQSHAINPCNIIEWQRIGVRKSTSMPAELADIHGEWGICIDIFPLVPIPGPQSRAYKTLYKRTKLLKRIAAKYSYVHNLKTVSGLKKQYYLFWSKIPDRLNVAWFTHLEEKILQAASEDKARYFCDIYENVIVERSWFEGEATLPFEGEEMSVPREYNKVLNALYGDNWHEIPPEEERVWHSGGGGEGFIVSLTEPYERFLI